MATKPTLSPVPDEPENSNPVATEETPEEAPAEEEFDPYDPANLRVSSFTEIVGVNEQLSVAVKRPTKGGSLYFRVHPGQKYWADVAMVVRETEGGDENYLVLPPFIKFFRPRDVVPIRLHTCLSNKSPNPFLYPVKIPFEGMNQLARSWAESQMRAVELAKTTWIKLYSDKASSGYQCVKAGGDLGEPDWGDLPPYRELIKLGFQGRVVDMAGHPLIREFNGELG